MTSSPDLWTQSGYDWRRPIVLPTLPVAPRGRPASVAVVVPDKERRDRLAFAIRAAMAGRTAQDIADVMTPRRSKETIARWARGETVPSALDVGPLAAALGVRAELLIDPPGVPSYPLAEYLVDGAIEVGRREGRTREPAAPGEPAPLPARRSRAVGTGRR